MLWPYIFDIFRYYFRIKIIQKLISICRKMACTYWNINFFRVGRTARGEGGKGHALLILRPEELGFLRYLRQAKVPLNEFEFSWSKISDIQPQLEKLVSKNYFLNLSAKEAFKAYVRSYESHSLKQVTQNYSNIY